MTAVILVALTTTILVAALPPTVTLLAPVKLVPVIVNGVPPLVGPEVGETLAMVGAAGVINSNALGIVAVPLGVVTATLCAPAAPAGVMAVIDVSLTTTTLVAATPPTFTSPTGKLLTPKKLVPVIVITVPPTVEP